MKSEKPYKYWTYRHENPNERLISYGIEKGDKWERIIKKISI